MYYLHKFSDNHRNYWNRERGYIFLKMAGLFAIAMVLQHFANSYVSHTNGVPVGDLILSNIPSIDIDLFIVQGVLIFTVAVIIALLMKPKYILFTVAALSVFIITRSFFISLTHLGIDPHEIILDTNSLGFGLYNILYNTKSDFFFSGHTGIPFLMGLIFQQNYWWSKICFAVSFILGASVLLGHVHYSIDVFAAPFMTYTIFVIAKKFFPKEYASLAHQH